MHWKVSPDSEGNGQIELYCLNEKEPLGLARQGRSAFAKVPQSLTLGQGLRNLEKWLFHLAEE